MKLWAMLRRATQDERVMVESSDKTWSIGQGTDKPLQYSCLEKPMNSMKTEVRKIIKELHKAHSLESKSHNFNTNWTA